MGNRLSRLVTKTGDTGMTHFGCDLIAKGHPAIEVLGDLDELNSHLGLVCALAPESAREELLRSVQQMLFDAGGEVFMADPARVLVSDAAAAGLEDTICAINNNLPPLREFVLPGGTELAARLHLARAVCRRAERHLWAYLGGNRDKHLAIARYLNRLSDLLFVLAREANLIGASDEVMWTSRRLAVTQGLAAEAKET